MQLIFDCAPMALNQLGRSLRRDDLTENKPGLTLEELPVTDTGALHRNESRQTGPILGQFWWSVEHVYSTLHQTAKRAIQDLIVTTNRHLRLSALLGLFQELRLIAFEPNAIVVLAFNNLLNPFFFEHATRRG